jgi:hypothetical protein
MGSRQTQRNTSTEGNISTPRYSWKKNIKEGFKEKRVKVLIGFIWLRTGSSGLF